MRKSILVLLACALLLCASVSKAEYYALHKLSIDPVSGSFDATKNTFSITSDADRTFSFYVGYEFLNLTDDEDMSEYNNGFPLNINFDKDLFSVASTVLYSENLGSNMPQQRDNGVYVWWNNAFDSWYNEDWNGFLIEITFTLNDDVSLEEFLSTEITFSLFREEPGDYSLNDDFGLNAPTITVSVVPTTVVDPPVIDEPEIPVTTPEPATLALVGLGMAGIGLARRRWQQ